MHQALYRKWRPKTFDSVYGQEHITSVLRYEILNNKCNHAYLFCGSRGTGKTTCAKLFAKAVNCLNPINGNPCCECEACKAIENETTADVIEMDAASNTGVDYIRDIRETVMYSPAMLKTRVFIIDEVHMLTTSAFNALLKTLEEPPSQVIFILATTEQQKIPATILSRCQKFEFRRISSDVIAERLEYIAKEENIDIDHIASKTIAKSAQGGMRDAISLLELCSGDGNKVTVNTVRNVTGALGREQAFVMANAILNKDTDAIFKIINDLFASSKEISVFWQELMDFYRDMLIFKTTKHPEALLDLSPDEIDELTEISSKINASTIMHHCTVLENAFAQISRSTSSKRICAEIALLKLCDNKLDSTPESIISRLSEVEEQLAQIQINGITVEKPEHIPMNHEKKDIMVKKKIVPDKIEKPVIPEEKPKVRENPRPLTWWIEAIKRLDNSVSAFLRNSRAYEDEGKIIIRVENDFSKIMTDSKDNRAKLAQISTSITGKTILPDTFVFIVSGKLDNDDPIDELE